MDSNPFPLCFWPI